MKDSRIKKIVLTGGPCAGKTRIIGDLGNYLSEKGYYVITLAETATQLIKSNMLPCMDEKHVLVFQDIILKMQLMKEEMAVRYAKEILPDEDVVILCDRAIMDNRAYLGTEEAFQYLLNINNLAEEEIINSYDFVIDLISTATAKKDVYQLDVVRSESVDDAMLLDKKTTLAWINHPQMIIVKPTEKIEEKSAIVVDEVNSYLKGIECKNVQFVKRNY